MMRAFFLVFIAAAGVRADTLIERFAAPPGTSRVAVKDGSFGASLRTLPLLPVGTPVLAYDGERVYAPWAEAVVDLDVGTRDLQQCADSAIRLYAEYRRARGTHADLVIHATSGDPIPYARYQKGERAFAKGRGLAWSKEQQKPEHASWRAWLDTVFLYAGSMSLARDTTAVTGALLPGDLLVVGGSPGHVLVVLDVATNTSDGSRPIAENGDTHLLLGQGFMPAQSFHVLGWYRPDDDGVIKVPSWPKPFPKEARRRFK